MTDTVAALDARLRDHADTLARLVDLMECTPGRPFAPRFGVLPRQPCRGLTRAGGRCNAHPALIGPTGYCHWHDPARTGERAGWRGRGCGFWRRMYRRVISSCDAAIDNHVNDPVSCPLPALLTDAPPGVRRVALALVEEPAGRSYREAAEALGVTIGTVRRQVVRLKERHPEAHAALLALRKEHRAARQQGAEERHRVTWAQRRAKHLARCGREPWE